MNVPREELELEAHLINFALDFAGEAANLSPIDLDGVPETLFAQDDDFDKALIKFVKLSTEKAELHKDYSEDPSVAWATFSRKALRECGVINPRFKRFEKIKLFSESNDDIQRELYEEAVGSTD